MSGWTRTLHPAERQYLLDAARGYTATQSAKRHGVSYNTVTTSLANAKAALGAFNIAHAVALAMAFGEFGHHDVLGRKQP